MPAAPDSFYSGFRSGYPYRTLVAFATILAVSLALAVLPVGIELAWCLAGSALVIGAALIVLRTFRLRHRVEQHTVVLAALTRSMAGLPESLRTRMTVCLANCVASRPFPGHSRMCWSV